MTLDNTQDTELNDEQQTPAEAQTPVSEDKPVDQSIPYDRFKAKVDEANALKVKLAAFEAAQLAEQQKALEDQNEFKTLYEQAQEQLTAVKADALNAKKNALLVQAGYSDEQTLLVNRLVDGETDAEIAQSIALLKATIPAQGEYADPSPMNGQRDTPTPTDPTDVGRSMFQRLRGQ